MHTLREPFADDLYAEAGAIDVGDGYPLITRYIRLFDLPLIEVPVSPKTVTCARGHRYVSTQNQDPDWPYRLRPAERQLGRAGIWEKYVVSAYAQIGEPSANAWPQAVERDFDSQTLNELLLRRGLSEDAVAVLHLTLYGDDYDHVSALQSLMTESFLARNRKWMMIQGGNDRLPKALAAKLGSRLRYGAKVVKLAQDAQKARVARGRTTTTRRRSCDRGHTVFSVTSLRDGCFRVARRENGDLPNALRVEEPGFGPSRASTAMPLLIFLSVWWSSILLFSGARAAFWRPKSSTTEGKRCGPWSPVNASVGR